MPPPADLGSGRSYKRVDNPLDMMRVLKKCLPLLAVAGAVAAWWFLMAPAFLGGPATYVMVSGKSMLPTLRDGDLVVLHEQASYSPADVVAFRVPEGEPGEGAIVIHRIAGGSPQEGFVMQGDNKNSPDPWRPAEGDVLGKMWFHIPGAGRALAFLQAPLPLATLAGWAVMLLVALGGRPAHDRDAPAPARGARSPAKSRGKV